MSIKPKPIRTLVTQPGSAEDVFTRMIAGCEALWRETHLESLVLRTIKLLCTSFHLPAFGLVRIHAQDASLQLEDVSMADEGIGAFSADLFADVLQQLRQIDLKSYDYTDGINHVEVRGLGINFVLLGDPQFDWYALIWQDFSADGESQRSAEIAVDFLVKQLQTTCRWFTRFSETQTLLHLDDLTGLYNYRYLELSIDREIKRAQRYNSSFSLLFIDLDDFKPINDQYGHLAGSQALQEVAKILKATVRDVDLVFRYGGDEFVVLLIESDAKAGFKTAQRIRERIQSMRLEVQPGRFAQVTASIGVAAFPEHGTEKDRLLSLADECMYESKRHGKNQVVLVGVPIPKSTPAPDDSTWRQD